MKRMICMLAVAALAGTVSVLAQPPGGGGRPGGGPPGGHNAVLAAIDADGDHVISAREIMNAAAALKKLDKNGDGQLTSDEVHRGEERRGQRGDRKGGRRGEEGGRQGQAGERRGGPPPQGGPSGRPTAEKFMQRAMTFDADKDGKLNQAELKRMSAAVVEEMGKHGPPGGHGGGPDGRGPRQGGGNRQRPDLE